MADRIERIEGSDSTGEYTGDTTIVADDNSEDGGYSQPRRNFATGTPVNDDDEVAETPDEESSTKSKNKSVTKLVFVTVIATVALFGIVMFFILRGTSGEETVVKDNSRFNGVNANLANTGSDSINFQEDYLNRYSSNSNTYGAANSNSMTEMGTVGNITAPPINYNGTIFQPNPNATPLSQAQTTSPTSTNGGGSTSTNTSTSSTPQPVREADINPTRETQVVELSENQANNNGMGRNSQVSLYFYERPGASQKDAVISRVEFENGSINQIAKPNFGTVLPVRILGRLHTLSTNGLARMELTRTVQGSWGRLPRGTIFVGRVSGGAANRVFVSLIGYIDSRSNRLVQLGGDLQGTDGALGIEGSIKRLGSRWGRVFKEVLSTAKDVGSAYLLGRSGGGGTVINNGQFESIPNAIQNNDATRYTLVPAGANAYVVINDLPPATNADERLANRGATDEEILRLIQTESPAEIEQMMPSLSPDGRRIAQLALGNQ